MPDASGGSIWGTVKGAFRLVVLWPENTSAGRQCRAIGPRDDCDGWPPRACVARTQMRLAWQRHAPQQGSPPMTAVISVDRRALPIAQDPIPWGEHLDQKGMTHRHVAGMLGRTIATRTGAERAQQVNLGEKLDVIAGPHGAGLHEILARVAGKAGAHEHVENVMHMWLGLLH